MGIPYAEYSYTYSPGYYEWEGTDGYYTYERSVYKYSPYSDTANCKRLLASELFSGKTIDFGIGAKFGSVYHEPTGSLVWYVKPHGAFYNMAAKDYKIAKGICAAIAEYNPKLILMALAGSEMIRAGQDCGLRTASEVFADRAYEEDGTLVARTKEGAMITDENEAIARVIRMVKEQKVQAITGKDISLRADSICVHGDGVSALAFVAKIREAFAREGIEICPLADIV